MKPFFCAVCLSLLAVLWAAPNTTRMTSQQSGQPGSETTANGPFDISGATSGVRQPRNVAVKDTKAFAALWKLHQPEGLKPMPTVDFKKYDVVAVFAGSKTTGGYSVEIKDVKRTKESATVNAVLLKPAPGAMVFQAFTSPFAMKAVPKLPKAVKFEVTEKTR
jgi:hypothetical protein